MGDRLAIDGGTPVLGRLLEVGRGAALLGDEERKAVLEVLQSRSLFRYYGPNLLGKVEAFERASCELLGCGHAVATSSGTAALRSSLAALGVGCGDEVIVPAFTFVATINAVVTMGAVPVFAEIDDSWGLEPSDVDRHIGPRTAAVIAVHLENCPCDLEPLLALTAGRGVPVLEDTAQAMGASYHGRALGTHGAMGAFSLQLEKNVTSGEGGLVVTDDETLFLRAACYQDQGGQFVTSTGRDRGSSRVDPFVGENLRMTEIAGAIAGVQLTKLPSLLARQRANHGRILDRIRSVPGLAFRRQPDPAGDGCSSVGLMLPDGETARRFARALLAEGVPAGRMYRGLPAYATESILQKRTASGKGGPWNCAEHPTGIEYRMGLCPATEAVAARSVVVVVAASYTEAQCDGVAEAVAKVAAAYLGG